MSGNIGFPQLDFSTYPSQVFWLVVTFVVMYISMSKLVLPPIAETIEKRKAKRKDNLEIADKSNQEAETIKTSYEASIDKARSVANKEIYNIENKINQDIVNAQIKYVEETEQRTSAATENIKKAKIDALQKINELAEDITKAIALKLADIKANDNDIVKLIKSLNTDGKD